MIGDEYEKQREALLKYYKGEVTKTSKFLDIDSELSLLMMQDHWAMEIADYATRHDDWHTADFFRGLEESSKGEYAQVRSEFDALDGKIILEEGPETTYRIKMRPEAIHRQGVGKVFAALLRVQPHSGWERSREQADPTQGYVMEPKRKLGDGNLAPKSAQASASISQPEREDIGLIEQKRIGFVVKELPQVTQEGNLVGDTQVGEASELPPSTDQQPGPKATETTPLLPTHNESDEGEVDSPSAFICGCPFI